MNIDGINNISKGNYEKLPFFDEKKSISKDENVQDKGTILSEISEITKEISDLSRKRSMLYGEYVSTGIFNSRGFKVDNDIFSANIDISA